MSGINKRFGEQSRIRGRQCGVPRAHLCHPGLSFVELLKIYLQSQGFALGVQKGIGTPLDLLVVEQRLFKLASSLQSIAKIVVCFILPVPGAQQVAQLGFGQRQLINFQVDQDQRIQCFHVAGFAPQKLGKLD